MRYRACSAIFASSLLSSLALTGCESDPPFEPQPRDPEVASAQRVKIEWPGRQFRTLQNAIDAAPSGALIEIRAGDYFVGPLVIREDLELAGAGSGRNGRGPVTRLIGRPPDIIDGEGGVARPAETEPHIAAYGIDLTVRDLVLRGLDAGIFANVDEAGRAGKTVVRDAVIEQAGRGIVALGGGTLIVEDTDILATTWHGISASEGFGGLFLKDIDIVGAGCAGIYVENLEESVVTSDASVIGAACGGIVAFETSGFFLESILLSNHYAGIALVDAPVFHILENVIQNTLSIGTSGLAGDGIALFLSPDVTIEDNLLFQSARAGVAAYGSNVTIGDNTILCSAFDIDNEIFQGLPTTFDDEGGNQCGCGGPLGECEAVSSQILPPPPVNQP